jgi:hypothetical protein
MVLATPHNIIMYCSLRPFRGGGGLPIDRLRGVANHGNPLNFRPTQTPDLYRVSDSCGLIAPVHGAVESPRTTAVTAIDRGFPPRSKNSSGRSKQPTGKSLHQFEDTAHRRRILSDKLALTFVTSVILAAVMSGPSRPRNLWLVYLNGHCRRPTNRFYQESCRFILILISGANVAIARGQSAGDRRWSQPTMKPHLRSHAARDDGLGRRAPCIRR